MTKFILVATKILHNSGMFKKKKKNGNVSCNFLFLEKPGLTFGIYASTCTVGIVLSCWVNI